MVEILADRYRLDERIEIGGVSTVWRAFDLNLNREVAIKILDLTIHHDDPETLARFQREAVATAGLNHPNIVAVYDTGIDKNLAYLVMELLTGPTLRELLDKLGSLQFEESLALTKSVADGLAAAHAIGIIHRDIKPSNVMLHHYIPKIVDFGIARLEQESGADLTQPTMTLGTPAYIAPEQALGATVTSASDIYSFGCLIMALLTGHPPFQSDQPLELTQMQVSDVPPRLIDLRPNTPPALDELVAQMLAKDPSCRPDAETVSAELGRLLADPELPTGLLVPVIGEFVETDTLQLSTTSAAGNLSRAKQSFSPEEEEEERPKFPTWLVGLVVLALLATAFAGVNLWLSASPKPSSSPKVQRTYSPNKAQPSASESNASTPSQSPSSASPTDTSTSAPTADSDTQPQPAPTTQPTKQPHTPTRTPTRPTTKPSTSSPTTKPTTPKPTKKPTVAPTRPEPSVPTSTAPDPKVTDSTEGEPE